MTTTITLIAQASAAGGLAATAKGLAVAALGALLSVVVAFISLVAVWQLMKASMKDPSWEKLAGIVGGLCFAAFLIAATPALIAASYSYGRSDFNVPAATAEAGQ